MVKNKTYSDYGIHGVLSTGPVEQQVQCAKCGDQDGGCSLSVNTERGSWYCRRCRWSGRLPKTYDDYGIVGINPDIHAEQRTTCPVCSASRSKPNDRCLCVNTAKGTWYCQNCTWAGAISEGGENEPQKPGSQPPPRTRRQPAQQPHTAAGATNTERHASPPQGLSISPATESVYKYFDAERSIPRAVVDAFGIGSEKRSLRNPVTGDFEKADAIAFPYYVGESLVNVKYRDLSPADGAKQISQVKGGQQVAFGLANIANSEYIIITEGEIDCMSFYAAGYASACSMPAGAIQPNDERVDGKLQFLEATPEAFQGAKRIYLATDDDPPGRRTAQELARRLGRHRCYLLTYPTGCKDANQVLCSYGVEVLQIMIDETAKPFPIEGVLDIASNRESLFKLYDNGLPPGDRIGVPAIDEHIRWLRGQVTTVTGIPGFGKSTDIDFITMCLATLPERKAWKIAYFTPENKPVDIHQARLISQLVGKPVDKKRANRMSREEYAEAMDFLQTRCRWVVPSRHNFKPEKILEIAAELSLSFGMDGFVIDPYGRMEHHRPPGMSETEYVASLMSMLSEFGAQHDCHIWLIAHPTKMRETADGSGNYYCPTLYSISGSAHFFNLTDNGIVIHQERDIANRIVTQFIVGKVKHDHYGKRGLVELTFDASNQRIYPMGTEPDRSNWLHTRRNALKIADEESDNESIAIGQPHGGNGYEPPF